MSMKYQPNGRSTADAVQADETHANIKKIGSMIKDIRIAMLTTVDEMGVLHSRPMATQEVDFDGDLWFFTSQETGKAGDIAHEHNVNVAYVSPGDERYVSIIGQARIIDDAQKMKQLWKPLMKAWFPEGLDDPQLRLIHVRGEKAEYWESKGGKVGALLGIVKNLVTGKTGAEGKNETVPLLEREED